TTIQRDLRPANPCHELDVARFVTSGNNMRSSERQRAAYSFANWSARGCRFQREVEFRVPGQVRTLRWIAKQGRQIESVDIDVSSRREVRRLNISRQLAANVP